MSYIFLVKLKDGGFNCLSCGGKFRKIVNVSISHNCNRGKSIESWFCEKCFKHLFGYENERSLLKKGIYREKGLRL